MKKRSFLQNLYAGLMQVLVGEPSEYKKKHSTKVRFSKYYRFHDNEKGRQLQCFFVHGESVMAYSKKDALKRWVHRDLKNRRKK